MRTNPASSQAQEPAGRAEVVPAWPGGQRVARAGTAQAEPLSAGMQPCLCQPGRSLRNPPTTPKGWESATLLQSPLPAVCSPQRAQSQPVPDVLPWPITPHIRAWSRQAAGGAVPPLLPAQEGC